MLIVTLRVPHTAETHEPAAIVGGVGADPPASPCDPTLHRGEERTALGAAGVVPEFFHACTQTVVSPDAESVIVSRDRAMTWSANPFHCAVEYGGVVLVATTVVAPKRLPSRTPFVMASAWLNA